jgi:hypothetical protein
MRQATTAEVCLDRGKAACCRAASRATRHFARAAGSAAHRISLRRTSMRLTIAPSRPGIRGMSDKYCVSGSSKMPEVPERRPTTSSKLLVTVGVARVLTDPNDRLS